MSKEKIRQLVSKRFADFTGLGNDRKAYPNLKDPAVPTTGQWAKLKIDFVGRKVTSIGQEPCTRRSGVIVIDVFERLDVGTANLSKLTDALEDWFDNYQIENLWCGVASTEDALPNNAYYASIVYIPFEYDEN